MPRRREALQDVAIAALVGGQARVGFVGRLVGLREQRFEVGREHAVEQLLDVVQHEIGLLVGVDQVVGAQHALQIEGDARGPGGARGVDGLAARGQDAGAVGAQAPRRAHQPELHRVPIQPREHLQRGGRPRVRADGAIGLDEIREHRVREHRQMPEEIVEQVGLDQIVELIAPAHPDRDRETPLGQVREEIRFGNQARHADHFETGEPLQSLAGLLEHRESGGRRRLTTAGPP